MEVLMCRPSFFAVNYQINPWMQAGVSVDQNLALKQWQELVNLVEDCGAKVRFIPPVADLPDMVFTANAGAILDNKTCYISNFRYSERRGESQQFKQWFSEAGYSVVGDTGDNLNYFEGAGDLLQTSKLNIAAFGFRSDALVYQNLKHHSQKETLVCQLQDPRFYHLDTCFCPLDDEQAIWFPAAFTPESQKSLSNKLQCHAVSEEEACNFACNAIVLNKNVIIPSNCPKTKALLEGLGFQVRESNVSEFLKAGGACKCLSLII